MRRGLAGLAVAMVVAGGVLAGSYSEGGRRSVRELLQDFNGKKEVTCPDYCFKLLKGAHLQVFAKNTNTEIQVLDIGSDGMGHPGDFASVGHTFSDGSKIRMELTCRNGWEYKIISKLMDGNNCVSESEFDIFKEFWGIRPAYLLAMDPAKIYGAEVYREVVESIMCGNKPREVPYDLVDEAFSKVEGEMHLVRAGKKTLNKVLYDHSVPLRVYAKRRIRELRRED